MKNIKLVAKSDIFGGLGHKIYTKDKMYSAYQAYPDDEEYWFVESDFIVNELPIYTWNFIRTNFYLIDEIRDEKIDKLLK